MAHTQYDFEEHADSSQLEETFLSYLNMGICMYIKLVRK